MTDIDIDAIRKREQAATPGPWGVGNGTFVASELKRLDSGSIQYRYAVAELDEFAREEGDYPNPVAPEADAEFIAAARTDVPALLAKVDELTAALAKSREQAATFANEIGTLTAENARLRQQRDAHTDVVEAAKDVTKAHRAESGPFLVALARLGAAVSLAGHTCPNCAPGYDCERGIYTPETQP